MRCIRVSILAILWIFAIATVSSSFLMLVLPHYGNPNITRVQRWETLGIGALMVAYAIAMQKRWRLTASIMVISCAAVAWINRGPQLDIGVITVLLLFITVLVSSSKAHQVGV